MTRSHEARNHNSFSQDDRYQLAKSLTHSHPLPTPSFHKLTLPSPQLTARILPANDQLTRQTASGKCGSLELLSLGNRGVEVQGDDGDGRECIKTVLSCRIVDWSLITALSIGKECCTHLGCWSYVHAWKSNVWSPSDIPNPVVMSLYDFLFCPFLPIFVICPYTY